MSMLLAVMQRVRPTTRGQQRGLGNANAYEEPFNQPKNGNPPPGDGSPITYRGQARPNDAEYQPFARPRMSIGYAISNTDVNTVNWTACGPIRPSMRMLTTRLWQEQGRQTRALEGMHTNAPVGVVVSGRVLKDRPGKMQGGRQNNLSPTTYRGQSYSQTTLSLR